MPARQSRRVQLYNTDLRGDYVGSVDDDWALVRWDDDDGPAAMEDRDELVFLRGEDGREGAPAA